MQPRQGAHWSPPTSKISSPLTPVTAPRAKPTQACSSSPPRPSPKIAPSPGQSSALYPPSSTSQARSSPGKYSFSPAGKPPALPGCHESRLGPVDLRHHICSRIQSPVAELDLTGCDLLTRWRSPRPVPPTNRQRMIKRPDRLPGDQAPDLHLLVAGARFEPATSGL